MILFSLRHFLFDFLYLLSSDESDLLDDESINDWSDSGSHCTHSFRAFSLQFDYSIGSVSCLGYGIFAPTGVDSKCDIFAFDVFIPIGVEYKGDRLIKMFWRSNSLFSFQT